MLNKKFITFFILIIISYSINLFAQDDTINQKEMEFNLSLVDEWTIKCSNIDKKYYKRDKDGGRSPYTFEAINDAIKNKYEDRYRYLKNKDILANAQLENIKDASISILRIDNDDNEVDITEKVKNGDELFCNEKASNDKLIYKSKPIYYFEGSEKCKSKFVFDDVHIANEIHEDIFFLSDFMTKGIEDDENKKKFIKEVRGFSKQNNGILCRTGEIPSFTIENINDYVSRSQINNSDNNIDNSELQNKKTECVLLNDEDLKSAIINEDRCEEELNRRNEEKEKEKEIGGIKNILNNFEKNFNTINFSEIINSSTYNEINNEIDDLISDLANGYYEDKLEIEEKYKSIQSNYENIREIFNSFNSYEDICVIQDQNYFEKSNFEDVKGICDRLLTLNNDLNNSLDSTIIYIYQRQEGFADIKNKKLELEKKVNNEYKKLENESKKQTEIKKEEESIIKIIKNINKDIKDLNDKITKNIDLLKNQNNNFNIEKVFPDQISLLSNFIIDRDEIDNKINSIESRIKKYEGNNQLTFYDSVSESKNNLVSVSNLINEYELEYATYEKYWNEREDYKKKIDEENKKKEEEEKKREEEAKERLRLEKEKENKEKELKELEELINKIKTQEDKINKQLLDIDDQIDTLKTILIDFKSNFDPTQTYEVNYIEDYNDLVNLSKTIASNVDEFKNNINKLPDDFDNKSFDISSKEELKENIPVLRLQLKELNNETLKDLKNEIDNVNTLLDSQLENLTKIAQDTKTQKEELTSDLKNKEKEVTDLTNIKKNLNLENESLKNEIKDLEEIKESQENDINTRNMYIYILIGILILLSGLLFFFISRRKSSDNDENNVQSYLSRIDELEQQLRRQSLNQTAPVSAPDPTINPNTPAREPKKEPSPQEIKNERLRKLYEDYEAAMKNPNLIEAFRMNYNAIGLERESKVVTGRRVTLRKVNTSFDRAIYWVVEHDKKLLVFGGRMLKVQAPSLLADDGTMARDLLQGIFELQTGPDLKTHKCAVVNRNNQIYEVMVEGVLQLPKVD